NVCKTIKCYCNVNTSSSVNCRPHSKETKVPIRGFFFFIISNNRISFQLSLVFYCSFRVRFFSIPF
ncbi:hypothetical protein WDU94_008554, partial [Cyamophila willieti]